MRAPSYSGEVINVFNLEVWKMLYELNLEVWKVFNDLPLAWAVRKMFDALDLEVRKVIHDLDFVVGEMLDYLDLAVNGAYIWFFHGCLVCVGLEVMGLSFCLTYRPSTAG